MHNFVKNSGVWWAIHYVVDNRIAPGGAGGDGTSIEIQNSQATRYGVSKTSLINAQKLGRMVGSPCLALPGALSGTYQQSYPQKL